MGCRLNHAEAAKIAGALEAIGWDVLESGETPPRRAGAYVLHSCAVTAEAGREALRRVRAGRYRLEDAHTLEQVIAAADAGEAEKLLLPVDSLFAAFPALRVGAAGEKRVRCGNPLPTQQPEGDYRLYSRSGEFLALVRVRAGEMKTVKSFFEI